MIEDGFVEGNPFWFNGNQDLLQLPKLFPKGQDVRTHSRSLPECLAEALRFVGVAVELNCYAVLLISDTPTSWTRKLDDWTVP